MTDIKPILEEILNEAKDTREKIREDTDSFKEDLKRAFDEEIKETQSRFEERLSEETDRLYKSEEADIRLYEKTERLRIKKEAIDRVVAAAFEEIADFEDKRYAMMLSDMYKKNEQGGTVYLNERDKKRLKPSVFQGAKIADKPIKTAGGFYQVCSSCNYNCTLEALAEERYNRIISALDKVYTEGE